MVQSDFPGGGHRLKLPGDLVQRKRKNKALRGFVHQVLGGRALKLPADLVQRKRKIKALRGFVHQVLGERLLKLPADLVQRERKIKALRGFVHQVLGGRRLIIPKEPPAFLQGGSSEHHSIPTDPSPSRTINNSCNLRRSELSVHPVPEPSSLLRPGYG